MNGGLRWISIGAFGALALISGHVCAQLATGSFDRTVTVAELTELDVTTGSGSIVIGPGAAGQVTVRGEIRVHQRDGRSAAEAEALARRLETDPPIEVTGNSVRVGHFDDDEEARENVSISYEITVPAATSVISRTGSGDQRVSGLAGSVDVRTGSGEVTLAEIGGAVEAATGSGDIEAERIAGAFNGHTGSGSVSLVQTARGDVEVSTGSGRVTLTGVDGGARVRTGSGSVALEGVPSGPWDLQTGSGSVSLRVPADTAFSLDVRSSSGQVYTSHAVTMTGSMERNALRGDVRGGGAMVRARTGSGGIRIE